MTPELEAIHALLEHDANVKLCDADLDDQLWLLLCDRLTSPEDLVRFSEYVAHYYSSRLIQWDVGNGGFVSAVTSSSVWFSHAAQGYDALGFPDGAALIRQAAALIPPDPYDAEEECFEALDARVALIDWQIDDQRIAYVRRHRVAFAAA